MAATEDQPPRRSLWRRIVGDGSHLGFWTLPVFIATALGGAVIAGALAQVYYGQQVARLSEESAAARSAAERAAEDIEAARQEALTAIESQVDDVRSALEAARPLENPATAGVVALTVELTPEPEPEPEPAPSPSPASPQPPQPSQGATSPGQDEQQAQGAPLAATGDVALAGTTEGSTPAEQPADEQPPAPAAGATTRNGVGFAVAVADGSSFIATSYGVVEDPLDPDGVAPAVEIATPEGRRRGVVHAWDEQRGVAVVRVDGIELPILPWRPADVAVDQGGTVVLAAVTQRLVGVQLPGRVGAVTDDAVLTDLPLDPAFDGAPLLDTVGRVVGLQAIGAEPLGAGVSGAVTARLLCVELINGCEQLEQEDETDGAAPEDDESDG